MASAAAQRIRAELFGSRSVPDNSLAMVESISELRAAERRAAQEDELPGGVSVTQCFVAGVAAEWILVSGADSPQATILFLHGGGFISGSCASYRSFAARLALASRCRVLVPEYRLAPEHRFPAPVEDVIAVYRELLRDGTDARRLVTVGDSAGGGLCAALLLAVRDSGGGMPAGTVLISPWTDLTLSGESYRTRASLDPIDRLPVLRRMAELYLGDSDPTLPLASPIFGDLRGLSKMLIQVGDHEVLLDDSTRFYERAKEDGVQVQMEVWPEMWHSWVMSAPGLPEANEAILNIGAFVREVIAE